MINVNELIVNLKGRINPHYQDIHGTESYERRLCVEALESLQAENQTLRQQLDAFPDMLDALEMCDEAMEYMSEYDIPLTMPERVKDAINRAKGLPYEVWPKFMSEGE